MDIISKALRIAHPYGVDTGLNKQENPATLKAQHDQVMRGHKPAMMFPKGTREVLKSGGLAKTMTDRGTFHYNPRAIDAASIAHASRGGRENEVLGLGPYSKADIAKRIRAGEKPVAIVERKPDGTEVKAAVGTDKTAPHQLAHFEKTKTPGNIVRIESPEHVVSGREKSGMAHGGIASAVYAAGGKTPRTPRPGLFHSSVPGRTDRIPIDVPEGSYILPAEYVAHQGEGNTLAGAKKLDEKFATGGVAHHQGKTVPIIVAGGEYLLYPEQIARYGNGDIKRGHDRLDAEVVADNKKHARVLSKLPPPRK